MLTYLEIAQRLRPRWIVWENVPGVLSSNGGRDFGAFLGALAQLRYGFAYRVLDAQYCRVDGRWPKAVPQRRRRVFVVGCDLERDPGGRERAAEVLALGTGLRWHLAESGKTRKAAPADAEAGVGASCVTSHDVAPCLETTCYDYSRADGFTRVAGTLGNRGLRSHTELDGHGAYVPVMSIQGAATRTNPASGPDGVGVSQSGVAYTLEARAEVQAVAQPVPYDLFQITAPVNRQNRKPGDPCHTLARDNAAHAAVAFAQNQLGEVRTGDISGTLNTNSNASGRNTPMVAVDLYNQSIDGDCAATLTEACGGTNTSGPKVMAFKPGQSAEARSLGAQVDVACTLEAGGGGNNKQAVAFDWQSGGDSRGLDPKDTAQLQRCQTPAVACPTLTAHNDPSRSPQSSEVTQQVAAVHAASMTVRRLTPRECERLQAFPDDYTLIPWRKKPAAECPDGPRYKALGNSMACNCMAWIGERIAAVEARHD